MRNTAAVICTAVDEITFKNVRAICPSIINFVLPFSTFDLPSKILYYCNIIVKNTKQQKYISGKVMESVWVFLHSIIPVISSSSSSSLLSVPDRVWNLQCLTTWSTLLYCFCEPWVGFLFLAFHQRSIAALGENSCSGTLSAFKTSEVLLLHLMRLTWEKVRSRLPFDTGREKRCLTRFRKNDYSEEFGALNSCHHTD